MFKKGLEKSLKETEKLADDFNSSIRFDKKMYRQDIQGSMQHAAMLLKQGILSKEDYQKIARAEQIRNASDYDDFYIASKEETKEQVRNAENLLRKIEGYLHMN